MDAQGEDFKSIRINEPTESTCSCEHVEKVENVKTHAKMWKRWENVFKKTWGNADMFDHVLVSGYT